MADNFTQFSFTLEELTKAEIKWIKKVLSYSIDCMADCTDDAVKLAKLLNTPSNMIVVAPTEIEPIT
jgi:hypothetical protein